MAVKVDEDIIRLQVSVENVIIMQVFEGEDDFCDVEPCVLLFQSDFLGDQVAEVFARAVVRDQVQVLRRLECEVHLQHEGVVRLF